MENIQLFTKENFLNFLYENNVNEEIIIKFNNLPEIIKRNENVYEIYINVTFHNINNTFYTFELNYYSEKNVEFLFNSKVFHNVEYSINNLLCELIRIKIISK